MANGMWNSAIERLIAEHPPFKDLKFILQACEVDAQNGRILIKVPGAFYAGLLQAAAPILRRHYGTPNIEINPDDQLQKAFQAKHAPNASAVPAVSLPAQPSRKETAVYRAKYFDIADHLSDQFHPRKNPYLVTGTNNLAYHTLERMMQGFPSSPNELPIMISAKIGQGKTHMLQSFAWRLHDKIIEARKQLAQGQAPAEERAQLEKIARSRIRYISGEAVVDEHKRIHPDAWKAVKDGDADSYSREREDWYAGVEWLFLDDIHAFAKGEREKTLEWMYKITDRFYNARTMLVSAIDTPPKQVIAAVKHPTIKHDLERLFTRLYSGGLIAIEDPTNEDLAAIINSHLKRMDGSLREISVSELNELGFFSIAKSYRDALGVGHTAYKYTLEGLPVEKAIANGIDALKGKKLSEGYLFTSA